MCPIPTSCHAVYEPRYLALFRDLLAENPARGRGGRFVHVLAPQAAPPALLDNAVGGLPRIGCCAEVDQIEVGAGLFCAAVLACWAALGLRVARCCLLQAFAGMISHHNPKPVNPACS